MSSDGISDVAPHKAARLHLHASANNAARQSQEEGSAVASFPMLHLNNHLPSLVRITSQTFLHNRP